jgi:hypothetical protein
MPEPLHAGLAAGRWHTLTIAEQMGNIGSEVSRALRANANGNQTRVWSALERALELFDLTTTDPRWDRHRRKEIRRAREVTCDYLAGDNQYGTSAESLDRYFLAFAVLARQTK